MGLVNEMNPSLEELRRLAKRLAGACEAETVVLFGSRSAGVAETDSDVDLALVFSDDVDLRAGIRAANRFLWPRRFPVDLVPMRKSTWTAGKTLLAREVAAKGIVLYEREAA